MKIAFNKPSFTSNETQYIIESINSDHISGNGIFTKKCELWFERKLKCKKTLLTPSCTHALEMVAILLDIKEGDEVIMPSFTFVSTANAFVLRGARIIFVDIRPDTMNIDETKIEQAITDKTKVIVPVHYAGVSCEMDIIMDIAKRYNLFVVEDAAQSINSTYKDKPLGTIGHFGTYSFHETKNITSAGEGGLLIINDEKFIQRSEIIREKGTNRSLFTQGLVDKYSWVDIGSSYLLNDVSAAYLWGQIEKLAEIQINRIDIWNMYYKGLKKLELSGHIKLPHIPNKATNNAHIFYIKVKDINTRTSLLSYLNSNSISAVFHYVALHTSKAGKKFGKFIGNDIYTSIESEKLIRLPLYYGINKVEVSFIINKIKMFFDNND